MAQDSPSPGPKKKLGRPKGSGLTYDRAKVYEEVLLWVAAGKTLREFCRLPGNPGRELVDLWRREDPTFANRFARARDDGFDAIAEEALAIADTIEDDENVLRDRLRIETRLKLLAKWDPRRYGERVTTEATGGITLQVVTGVPRDTVVPALPSNSEVASQRVSLSYENHVVSETTPKPVVQSEESGQ